MKKLAILLLLAVVLINTAACDPQILEPLGLWLLECAADTEPEFEESLLPPALLNQKYQEAIHASVRNSDDSLYNFRFGFTGELPPGLNLAVDPDNRRVIIKGTPTQLGSYVFTVRVDVEERLQGTTLCSSHAEKTYTIDVFMM